MRIYLIGSLKDPDYPLAATRLREDGHDVVDDWRGSGPDGDARWRDFETQRGNGYITALDKPFAANAFNFDRSLLNSCDIAVAVCKKRRLPGASAIAELAYMNRNAKSTFCVLNDEPDDWDLMIQLIIDQFCNNLSELSYHLKRMEIEA